MTEEKLGLIRKIKAGFFVLISKIGFKLLNVFIKLAKFGKVGLAIGTAASYSYLFTWKFALIIMAALFIHESGHVFAMKRCGVKTKGMYYIPFMGMMAVAGEPFKSRKEEVYIAIMGPIWGLALAVAMLVLYFITKNAFFGAVAGFVAFINLFNLLPINPLDGGRIIKSVAFSISSRLGFIIMVIGIIASVIMTFYFGVILFSILLVMGLLEVLYEYKFNEPNQVIKSSKKDIDKYMEIENHVTFRIAIVKLKNILYNEEDDPLTKIEKIKKIANKKIGIKKVPGIEIIENKEIENDKDSNSIVIARMLLSNNMMNFNRVNKMSKAGVVASILLYISVAIILWWMMVFISNIPEVDIARKIFMG
jgi:Zn-dependent protease